MSTMDIAMTPSVKAIQEQKGSRAAYQKVADKGGWESEITPDLASFLAERDSVYLGTATADGRPYIQHRGGQPGFLKMLGPTTFGFADYAGNKQYLSLGNLAENDRAFLFAMDYANRRRIKIWGRARVVEDDAALLGRLHVEGTPGSPERAIVFEVEAWDVNCPKYIPRKLGGDELAEAVAPLQARIAELEKEVAELRAAG